MKYQCCHHIETSQLICYANQLTGFYMRATLVFNGLRVVLLLSSVKQKYDDSQQYPLKNMSKIF